VVVTPVSTVAARAARRPATARPELLDRLPTSFWISPPMVAVGGVSVLLYGLVLFGVVSARRHAPLPELPPEPERPAFAVVTPSATPETPEPKPGGSSASSTTPSPAAPSPPGTPAAPAAETKKASAPEPPRAPTPVPKTEVAVATPKAAAPAPAPVPAAPAVESWGALKLAAPAPDSHLVVDGTKLVVNIPGSLHVLSPELRTMNAPRLLTPVHGDFTATVTVPGRILPGTEPLQKPSPLPFTFQGAGLLLWQDEANYLRLERSSFYDVIERKRLHRVLVEACREGKTSNASLAARDADLTLKFDRRGSEVRCQYTPDGRNWIEVKRQPVPFGPEVQVGVSASNASPKPFAARLEDFQLSPGK
jgi:regulation of enolase protein 1 (concanavalin A-like superfamily)